MSRIVAALTWFVVSVVAACGEVLITEGEAALPETPDSALSLRGVTRGPAIEQTSPAPTATVHSPLSLQIKFVARNNTTIDAASVRARYLKKAPVDLTERLRTHISADGINMTDAEVPPGTHLIRIDVKDSLGRASTSIITLKVAK